MQLAVGMIGTGDPTNPESFAMAYRHARGYNQLPDCSVVCCADIVHEHAQSFAETFDIPTQNTYQEYELMLEEESPNIVSVCTPPRTHAEIVSRCAKFRSVRAIHCEKPMAATWQECREMVQTCSDNDVQLTFNHQRRFAAPFRKAKSLLDGGEIGSLRRIEVGGQDLYDYGSHLFDLCGMYTDQTPVDWVLAGIDYREPSYIYGLPRENQALARWKYRSGIEGLASTGEDGMIDCQIRLIGDQGTIEVGPEAGPALRMRTNGNQWSEIDTNGDGVYRPNPGPARFVDAAMGQIPIGPDRLFTEPTYVDRAIEDIVTSLRTGDTSELSGKNAKQSTEIIFGCWESARQRNLVEFPLEIDDNPLEELIQSTVLRAQTP